MDKVNIADKFATFDTHWDPKVVGEIDDYEVKLVKLQGDFVWHKHDHEDEMFFVVEGTLEMAFRDGAVTLGPGEMIVVPKGIEHKPSADEECRVMLFERKGVINTGDAAETELTRRTLERI